MRYTCNFVRAPLRFGARNYPIIVIHYVSWVLTVDPSVLSPRNLFPRVVEKEGNSIRQKSARTSSLHSIIVAAIGSSRGRVIALATEERMRSSELTTSASH